VSDRTPRIAAISGGSAGIGRAVAEALGRLGWKVALGARGEQRLAAAGEAVRAAGGTPFTRRLDVTDAADVDAFFDAADASLGPVDAVVCCAAHALPGRLHERPADLIRAEIEVGLIGALLFARRGIRGMVDRGGPGDVLFVSSTTAAVPWPHLATYAASKAGVEQAARTIALELEGTGIRASVVRVGNTTGTDWARDWTSADLSRAWEDWPRFGLLRHPALMQPAQVAHAIVAALTAPPGMQLDLVTVNPVAPSSAR